jgi:hypothetical protein
MFPGTGCVIDGSHMSSIDFTLAVIDYAISQGFEIDHEQYRNDVEWLNDTGDNHTTDDPYYDIMDALDWTYEDALEYLNEIDLHRGYVWVVDEQSLFREKSDD